MARLGASVLEHLLAADPGHRGARVECGAGHQAEFVSYRAKTIDTVLGPVDAAPGLVSLRAVRARDRAQGR